MRGGCGKQAVTEKRKRQDWVGGAAFHPQQQDKKQDGARDQNPTGCAGAHQAEQEYDHANRQEGRARVIDCGSFMTTSLIPPCKSDQRPGKQTGKDVDVKDPAP